MRLILLVQLILVLSATRAFAETYVACADDKARLDLRSKELASLVKADQDDRSNWEAKSMDERFAVAKRDVERRKRVGEIFGEGCFSRAEDYAAAALVYQHGDVPDHFFQTFLWAKRAVELGDASSKRLMAMAVDRYLAKLGHKQLFGTQASMADADKPGACWCLDQIERAFPDRRRAKLFGKKLADSFVWLRELNTGKTCSNRECSAVLKASPKGTVPGFW